MSAKGLKAKLPTMLLMQEHLLRYLPMVKSHFSFPKEFSARLILKTKKILYPEKFNVVSGEAERNAKVALKEKRTRDTSEPSAKSIQMMDIKV